MATWIWAAASAIMLISALNTQNYALLVSGVIAAGIATIIREIKALKA